MLVKHSNSSVEERTDWFQRHVKLSGVISCRQVKELRSLYIYVYVLFCLVGIDTLNYVIGSILFVLDRNAWHYMRIQTIIIVK